MHTHTREDETVYVLDGAITADVGGEKTASKPDPMRRCRRTCRTP
jgi:uncharacterized cupin superfamily protein